ncbi:MAG: HAD family phosphatase [Sphingobacteriales bacterium]|nr:MAG: HAD family phosphatase [Sphingobacteriales bacterium]
MPVPNPSQIQTLLFDLGGVILNIDYGATEAAFRNLGIPEFETQFSQLRQNAFFDDWETGALSRVDWLSGMRAASGHAITDAQIIEAWNAMLLNFPIHRLQLLQQLRNRYNLMLLSNTNEVHEEAFNALLKAQTGLPTLAVLFDKVYYSHRVGMRKPNAEIFRKIIDENNLKPEEILFIDDSPQHIETANQLGLQTIHLVAPQTIETIFRPMSTS